MFLRLVGLVCLIASAVLIGCQNVPAPEWGPQEREDHEGKKSYGWGPHWEFRPEGAVSSPDKPRGTVGKTDPALAIVIETVPIGAPSTGRKYRITVLGTTGSLTNATRDFTTLAGAITVGNELFDDAGFTSATDTVNRDDLEDWLTSEWISAGTYHTIFGT